MKYYIPTSTLNFNNILSSESISPQSFYQNRQFGYSRWTSIEENNNNDIILLYNKPFEFKRPASDSEDHPMLIEIESEEKFNQLKNGVYFCIHTIYINPWDCKFIFFNQKDLLTTMSLSDSSLETKMIGLYKNHIVVEKFNNRFDYNIEAIPDVIIPEEEIKKDILLNKMKGLLYGYYIGALLSTTPEIIQKIRTLREIQNIFASVLSSEQRILTTSQKDRLTNLFNVLNKQQPIFQELLREIGDEEKVIKTFSILKKYGHKFYEFDHSYLVTMLESKDVDNNSAMSWVENELDKIKSFTKRNRLHLKTEKEEIITANLELVAVKNEYLNEREQSIFINWVNKILSQNKYNGNINTFNADLSDQLTASAKDIIGDGWENCNERIFLNHLRRHVRGESFTLPWDNGLFPSIAAVITKGDDWVNLLKFMQSKGMNDYRLAFSIYGVLNGFANLTRDFTDIILNDDDRVYKAQVYKEFYGQLLGKDVIGKSFAKEYIQYPTDTQKSDENKTIHINSIAYPQQPKHLSLEVLKWQDMIREMANRHIKSNKALLLASIESALIENGDNTDNFKFLTLLDNYEGWRPTASGKPCVAWKKLQSELVPNFNERLQNRNNAQNESKTISKEGIIAKGIKKIFVNETKQNKKNGKGGGNRVNEIDSKQERRLFDNILDDRTWIDDCAIKFISDTKVKKQFSIDMEWFINNYQEYYYDEKKKTNLKGIYSNRNRENSQVIDNLNNYMNNKRNNTNPKTKWLADIYADIPIDIIVSYLRKRYV